MKTKIQYRVIYADTDQMGVVYYGNYFSLFERVRNEWLREQGVPYTAFEENGIMLPVTESFCKHTSPAIFDDLLTLTADVIELTRISVTLECEVFRGDTLLAKGYTKHACMSSETRRITRFPKFITDHISVDGAK
ncbi:MAG: acyl-CoA thioesterase [Lentisphaeria bacterium]|nr:acyl-CoA thioesterase [Lentisphaeria bacterium]